MKKSAQILSVIFHPYLLPLYGGGMIVSYSFLEILPVSIRLLIVSGIFLFSGILPMLFHLTLSLFYLNKSEKKPYVRLTEILLYTVFLIFATIYLHKLNLPYCIFESTEINPDSQLGEMAQALGAELLFQSIWQTEQIDKFCSKHVPSLVRDGCLDRILSFAKKALAQQVWDDAAGKTQSEPGK